MLVKTLWFWRKSEEGPELLVAWDEYSVDCNWDGWQAACRKELDAVRPEMSDLGYRYVDVRVDGAAIEQMFYANEIEGAVTASTGSAVAPKPSPPSPTDGIS